MAKNIRRMLAMVLVMCMFVSALPMQALAAEEDPFTKTETFTGESVTIETPSESEIIVSGNNDSGAALDVTGTSESKSDSYTDENTDTEIKKDITHVELSGTESADGVDKKVEYMEDKTVITETETDGTVTEKTTVDGLEKKEWNEYDVEPGQEVPSVQVQLQPGATNSNSGSGSYTKEEDNVAGGSTAQNSDKTTTTTEVDRVVEGTRTEVGVTVNKTDSNLTGSVSPEDYDGKFYGNTPALDGNHRHFEGLLKGTSPEGADPGTQPDAPGYNFVLSGTGDATYAAAPVFKNIVYVKDENGNPVKDENGNYIIDEEKSQLVYAGSKAGNSGMNGTPSQIVLKDENGNLFYTYCIDKVTPTREGSWYKISNLEDSDYYPDEESENKLRAIVQNGYWGTAEGTGSLENVKALMRETYGEEDTVTVTDEKGVEHTYNVVDLIDNLNEHEALACTQAAIWSYSNGSLATMNGQDGVAVVGVQSAVKYYNNNGKSPLNQYGQAYNLESDAVMKALYDCLMGLDGITASEAGATTIINENHNIKDMYLTVNEKVAEQGDKDIYNVDLQFTLDFDLNVDEEGNLKDDLYVTLLGADKQPIEDADGNAIRRKLSLTEEEGSIVANEDGVYTLTDLNLAEGEDFEFSLQLDGTQEINDGVYIYQAYAADTNEDGVATSREASQTLVGLASGTQDVNITVTSKLNFSVEERVHIKEEHVWHHEYDPVITPPETPDPQPPQPPQYDPEPIDEEPVQQVFRLNNQEEAVEEIPEEPVPLAAPVITGDNSGLWIAVMLLSVFAMAAINLFDKKRQHEAF